MSINGNRFYSNYALFYTVPRTFRYLPFAKHHFTSPSQGPLHNPMLLSQGQIDDACLFAPPLWMGVPPAEAPVSGYGAGCAGHPPRSLRFRTPFASRKG